jgi:E3 ubiquitin-protein ligase SHPRH
MRDTISYHVESTGTQAVHIWPDTTRKFRPNLNVALLATIISDIAEDSDDIIMSNGKRKVSGESFESNKRARSSQPFDTSHAEPLALEATRIDPSYPRVEVHLNRRDTGSDIVPILRHVLEIQYTHEDVSCNMTGSSLDVVEKWKFQDETLRERLLALSGGITSPKSIALGEIMLGEHGGRCVGLSATSEWLVLLPPLTVDADSNDLSASASDLLQACRTLQSIGQIRLRASLRLMVHPQDSTSTSFPTFSLFIDIDIALDVDAVLRNIMPNKLKTTVVAVEDARRRLFRAAFMPQAVASDDVNDPVTVSSFYSILCPAPPLSSTSLELSIQPEGLLPSLLPFQRRSVAWLLEREGMAFSPEGTLVQSSTKEYSFWNEIKEGDYTFYLNRLSGELSIEAPAVPTICGGMLAEEPGLGKTVETIALILMNPAPPSWNPTLMRDDPQGRADINAVKVCVFFSLFFLSLLTFSF